MNTKTHTHRIAAGLCVTALLAACQTPAPREAVPSDLRLIGAAPLKLPQNCSATASVVVDFTVREDGRTTSIQPATAAPECVQQALTAWIASFRYSPLATETRTSVEWLLVEANRGS